MTRRSFADLVVPADVERARLPPGVGDRLARDGYTVLPSLLSADDVKLLRALCDGWAEDPLRQVSEGGNLRLVGFDDRYLPLVRALTAPAVLASLRALLERPFRLMGAAFRDPRPGLGLQGLHADVGEDHAERVVRATVLVLIDTFTEENGATRVVPGSHLRRVGVPKRFAQPLDRHPDEVRVLAPEGSVLVMNGHLWHAGARNESKGHRRVVQATFDGD